MKRDTIPNEILHWSERAEFKAWQREQKMALLKMYIKAFKKIVKGKSDRYIRQTCFIDRETLLFLKEYLRCKRREVLKRS